MLNLKQRGDTIVEVMIVLAVLGSAISISYATANRSLLNARQAQEASQATVLAQSQVEQLRTRSGHVDATKTDDYIYVTSAKFCITSANKVGLIPSDPNAANPCSRPDAAAPGVPYDVSIEYNPNPTDTFTVKVIWDDLLGEGNGKDTVTLNYRVHRPPISP